MLPPHEKPCARSPLGSGLRTKLVAHSLTMILENYGIASIFEYKNFAMNCVNLQILVDNFFDILFHISP